MTARRRLKGLFGISVLLATAALLAVYLVLSLASTAHADPGAAFWAVCPEAPANGCDFATIQGAVGAASAGDIIRVVGPNVYAENLDIDKEITLLGGCANAACAVRVPAVYVTTIDGGGNGRAVTIVGNASDPPPVTLDGFFITGGDATNESYYAAYGGGIGAWYSDLTVLHSVVTDNVAAQSDSSSYGGGLYTLHSTVNIRYTNVLSNYSASGSGNGGGIALQYSDGVLDNVLLRGNVANVTAGGAGGGLYLSYCDPMTLTGNAVYSNIASLDGNGYGGGIYVYESDVRLIENGVRENFASPNSIGLGGGLYFQHSTAALQANWVLSNTAAGGGNGYGGGVYMYDNVATMEGDVLMGNSAASTSAPSWGNGIHVEANVSPTLLTAVNVILAFNTFPNGGHAVYAWGVQESVALTIVNSTIVSNTSTGIFCDANSTATLVNLILWNNGDDLAGCTASYSDIEDGDAGTGNISADPRFVDAAGYDFHLRADSPCVDAGAGPSVFPYVPDTDWDGDVRPMGSGYDIGGDEVYVLVYLPLVLRDS